MGLNKLSHVLKYYNLFSYIYLKYFVGKTNITIGGVYVFTAPKNSAASWWDVFDGILWICTFIAAIITYGFMFGHIAPIP